jgi:hypothetical protein
MKATRLLIAILGIILSIYVIFYTIYIYELAIILCIILSIYVIYLQFKWLYNLRKAGDKLLDAGNELGNKNIFDAGKLIFSTISQILIFIFIFILLIVIAFFILGYLQAQQ